MNDILYEGIHNLFSLLPNHSGFPGRCDDGGGGVGGGGGGGVADRVLFVLLSFVCFVADRVLLCCIDYRYR